MAEILANPMVEALLAAIILISLAAEVKTAGFSGGALVAAIAGAILIGARWGDGSPSVMEFILFFSGMALIIMDILFLFSGAAAVIGLVAVMTGLFFTFGGGVTALYIGCSDPFGCRLLFHRRPPVPEPAVAKAHPPYGAEGEGRIPFFLFRLQKLRGERGGCPFHPPSFGKGENRGLRTRCGLRWRVY